MGLGINNARRTFLARVSGLVSLDSLVIFYSIIPIIALSPHPLVIFHIITFIIIIFRWLIS